MESSRHVVPRPEVQSPWSFEIERGPAWLFVKPSYCPLASHLDTNKQQFTQTVWNTLTQHLTYRLVIEIDDLEEFPDGVVDELISLKDRLEQHDGMLHFSGHNELLKEAFEQRGFCPNVFPNREEAVMGTMFRHAK